MANQEIKMNSRERAAYEQQKESKKMRTKYILIGIIIVLLAALVIFVNSKAFTNGIPAMKVLNDGQEVASYTVADVKYASESSYMTLYNNYGSYLSYLMDTSVALDEQTCAFDDSMTWAEYFINSGEENLRQDAAFYSKAIEAGYALTEEDEAEVQEAMDTYQSYADQYGYTLNGYLAALFGEGNDKETVQENMEHELIATAYLNDLYDSFEYTQEELDTYYDENAADLNQVKFNYHYFSDTEADEEAGTEAIVGKEQAEAVLAAMKNETAAGFAEALQEVAGEEPVSTYTTVSSFLSNYTDEMEEADLKEGLCFTHESSSGCYVIFITGFEDNDYNPVTVRHILVKAEDSDGDGVYSEEELAVAEEAIKAIEADWKAGAATEETFAELAVLKSEDEGSASEGGIYEDITRGSTVAEFDAFCFADHKYGDTAIVKGESTSYTGYHLIYFVGADGENYRNTLADSSLRSEDYNAEVEEILEPYTTEHTGMWKYVTM